MKPMAFDDSYPSGCLVEQLQVIQAESGRFRQLHDALRSIMPPGHPGDLPLHEWMQIYAMTLSFEPDLIIELGRGYGNSTIVFCEASRKIDTRLFSICITDWSDFRSKLKRMVPSFDTSKADIQVGDIRLTDWRQVVKGAKRVLIFWDAHGFDVADVVLSTLLPEIAHTPHLVLMHDIGDARYQKEADSYDGFPIWKGEEESWPGPSIRLGHIYAHVRQAIAALDFVSRNGIQLRSVQHSLETLKQNEPEKFAALSSALSAGFFETSSIVAWFSLNERSDALPPSFPSPNFAIRNVQPASLVTTVNPTIPGRLRRILRSLFR